VNVLKEEVVVSGEVEVEEVEEVVAVEEVEEEVEADFDWTRVKTCV
jgi:hypothetical protein